MTFQIVCSSDDKYVPHTAAMLHSMRINNPSADIHLHYLHGPELSRPLRARLENMLKQLNIPIHWVRVSEALTAELDGRDYISKVVWYRVFLPQLLPDIDQILYIDCDTLVLRPLDELFTIQLGDCLFAAVTNVVPVNFRNRAAELGLPGPEHYFNAGVALWNLQLMRKEEFTDRVIQYAHDRMPQLKWLEQDAINALYWNRRLHLHPRWNAQNGIFEDSWGTSLFPSEEIKSARERPSIVHFEGGSFAKPWHLLCHHPYKSSYVYHRSHTPWPMRLPDGISPKNLLKKFAPEWAYSALKLIYHHEFFRKTP